MAAFHSGSAAAGAILAMNAGSSSLKFGLYRISAASAELTEDSRGELEWRDGVVRFLARHGADTLADESWSRNEPDDQQVLLDRLLSWVEKQLNGVPLSAAGHRVVHGGRDFHGPVSLDPVVIQALEALTPLAPLHQPHCLAPVRALQALRPDLPQMACFDTSFHSTMSPDATRLPIPARYATQGLRRYGFHGLSYEHIACVLAREEPALARGRVVVAHLGSGASLCAMENGRSVDTTMGFSVLDGLMMGTRPGSLDPGVLLYLLQHEGMSAAELQDLLYHQAGLLGVSGVSSDVRSLASSDAPAAREALSLFVFRLVRELGGMITALGGIDALVFTGGIGEHAATVRDAVCARLGWLGLVVDDDANRRHARRVEATPSRVAIRIIAADEEAVIARQSMQVLRSKKGSTA